MSRTMIYLALLIGLLVLCVWSYKAMIDIKPQVNRPKLDQKASQAIDDLEGRLRRHVVALAKEIGPRGIYTPDKLKAAVDYIRNFWQQTGYQVSGQTYKAGGVDCENLVVQIQGQSKPDEILIVGAHYDTVSLSPGANDNGSAIAALLEISRLFSETSTSRTLRFVAFANEEPPFFKTSNMGNLVYAKQCRNREENIVAMLCLETIGYYRNEPETQKYPFPLSLFYPDTGDFIAVVGNLKSKPLVKTFARSFMEQSDFPVECAAPFGFITGVDWSDHWSFWKMGYQAVMLTDTALFRYPYYHSMHDTHDKLDYESLARVTHGIYGALGRFVLP